MSATQLRVTDQRWPLLKPFRISRGTKSEAHVVVVTLERHGITGRGECVPYARYGESFESVIDTIENFRADIRGGATRPDLLRLMKPGAARNALDCALWDLEAKQYRRRVWSMAGIPAPPPAVTALTISLDTPQAMAEAARLADAPLLKLKAGGPDDLACISAVRSAAPGAALIVDPNEAWTFAQLKEFGPELKRLGVALIEQPLPAGTDAALEGYDAPVPICADESFHSAADLPRIAARYAAVNIKLDKAGGLTAALALACEAQNSGLSIMLGSMVATSLSMAPAFMLSGLAHFLDLDSPMLLAKDRDPPMPFARTTLSCPPPELWG